VQCRFKGRFSPCPEALCPVSHPDHVADSSRKRQQPVDLFLTLAPGFAQPASRAGLSIRYPKPTDFKSVVAWNLNGLNIHNPHGYVTINADVTKNFSTVCSGGLCDLQLIM